MMFLFYSYFLLKFFILLINNHFSDVFVSHVQISMFSCPNLLCTLSLHKIKIEIKYTIIVIFMTCFFMTNIIYILYAR